MNAAALTSGSVATSTRRGFVRGVWRATPWRDFVAPHELADPPADSCLDRLKQTPPLGHDPQPLSWTAPMVCPSSCRGPSSLHRS